jgi:predicted GIY-YIG superfamily endonuclease
MVMKTFIYILENPITNEIRYVGKTNNPKNRLHYHWTVGIKSNNKTTINLSRIDIQLQIYTNTNKEIKIQYWNEHLNCVRRCNGLFGYGYGYSKV